jgi:hypothetical protein
MQAQGKAEKCNQYPSRYATTTNVNLLVKKEVEM